MRRLLALALVAASAHAAAQQPHPQPQNPPLPALQEGAGQPPAVRIRPGKQDKVERSVIGGRTVLRVTPPGGRPYYLVEGPDGWQRRESLDDGTIVPMWTIYKFD
jgi:hypothetical protein